jgi:DNA-binding transcriptional MerR regulator
MGNKPTGATVPMAVKSIIKAARANGMTVEEIQMMVGLSPNTVDAVVRDIEGPKSQIAGAAAEDLKKRLPARCREIASLMADRLADPELIEKMNGKDLAIAFGIMIDKAELLEQGGNHLNVLVLVQNRVDQVEQERLVSSAKPALPTPPVEDAIVVQPCPPAVADNSAPPKTSKASPAKPRQKRAAKPVR